MNILWVRKIFSLAIAVIWAFSTWLPGGSQIILASFAWPQLSIHINENTIYGFDWPIADGYVTVTIEDLATPVSPDYITSPMPWDPIGHYYYLRLETGFTLEPGQIVTITDGTTEKSITVVPFVVTNVDPETDTVSGQTAPYAIAVAAIAPDWAISRHAYADSTGFWTVDFSVPGSEPNEQQTFDIMAGTSGQSYTSDEDGDTVQVSWVYTPPLIPIYLPLVIR